MDDEEADGTAPPMKRGRARKDSPGDVNAKILKTLGETLKENTAATKRLVEERSRSSGEMAPRETPVVRHETPATARRLERSNESEARNPIEGEQESPEKWNRGDRGIYINTTPAQKPTKLTDIKFRRVQVFKWEFAHYQEETKGWTTLKGHLTEKAVSMIDSLIGSSPKYQHLLGHGTTVNVAELSEEERATYPWLNYSRPSDWGPLLDTVMKLRPEGGSYSLGAFEHAMALVETCQLDFSLDMDNSREDAYMDNILRIQRKVPWSDLTREKRYAFFTHLIKGSERVGGYEGLNVSPRSKEKLADQQRVETMKGTALLEATIFKTIREFVDWLYKYTERMRTSMATAMVFQGRGGVKEKPRRRSPPKYRTYGEERPSRFSPQLVTHRGFDESIHQAEDIDEIPVPEPRPPRREEGTIEDPCEGCGAPQRHKVGRSPGVRKEECPFRSHPDWNTETCSFAESRAGRKMREEKIPHMSKAGAAKGVMNRLSPYYRAMMKDGKPVRLETPISVTTRSEDRRQGTRIIENEGVRDPEVGRKRIRNFEETPQVRGGTEGEKEYEEVILSLIPTSIANANTIPVLIHALMPKPQDTTEARQEEEDKGPLPNDEVETFPKVGARPDELCPRDTGREIRGKESPMRDGVKAGGYDTTVCGAFGECQRSFKKPCICMHVGIGCNVTRLISVELKVLES